MRILNTNETAAVTGGSVRDAMIGLAAAVGAYTLLVDAIPRLAQSWPGGADPDLVSTAKAFPEFIATCVVGTFVFFGAVSGSNK